MVNYIDKHNICRQGNTMASVVACGNSRRGEHTYIIVQNQKINIILIPSHTKTAFL